MVRKSGRHKRVQPDCAAATRGLRLHLADVDVVHLNGAFLDTYYRFGRVDVDFKWLRFVATSARPTRRNYR